MNWRSAVLLTCLGLGSAAHAQTPSAEHLLERGVSLREAHRDAEALRVFEEAYSREHSARALAQIALAEQALGRFISADAWVERHEQALRSARDTIAAELASLTITTGVGGATLLIDGIPAEEQTFVTPGEHLIAASAEGYAPRATRVSVAKGAHAAVDLLLAPTAPPAAAASLPPPAPVVPPTESVAVAAPPIVAPPSSAPVEPTAPPRRGDLRWFYGVGAGAALGAASLAVYLRSSHLTDAALKSDGSCHQAISWGDCIDHVRRLDRTSWALLGVGAAAAAGSAYGYLWSRRRDDAGPRVTWMPAFTPSAAAFYSRVRF